MSEEPVMIPCGMLLLEALFCPGSRADAAVICHPHPLYGGSMDNNVVSTLQKTLQNWGWGTLRFNFRGVGGSTGHHKGAQGDAEDLLTVFRYVRQQGKTNLHLAGYSYGAWIGLKAMKQGLQPNSATLVSPPLDFLDFSALQPPSCPCLITLGDQDDFCTVASLKKWVAPQSGVEDGALIEILPHCDHFYWGQERLLSEKITGFLRRSFHPGCF
jgi:alpha/beta superfamily hydrolase